MHHLNKSIIMIILNFKKQAKTIKYIQKKQTNKQNKTNKIKKLGNYYRRWRDSNPRIIVALTPTSQRSSQLS